MGLSSILSMQTGPPRGSLSLAASTSDSPGVRGDALEVEGTGAERALRVDVETFAALDDKVVVGATNQGRCRSSVREVNDDVERDDHLEVVDDLDAADNAAIPAALICICARRSRWALMCSVVNWSAIPKNTWSARETQRPHRCCPRSFPRLGDVRLVGVGGGVVVGELAS